MDLVRKFESEMVISLNQNIGLSCFKCVSCNKIYRYHRLICICGHSVYSQSLIPIYRDCGCLITPYAGIGFTLQNIKHCKIRDIVKNYDLGKFIDTQQFLYVKVGSQTDFNFIITDCHKHASDCNYTLLLPNENNNMKINNIPCKLYYTELTKSSYKGYFSTYIIVLNYDMIYNLIGFRKLLRRIYHDKRSLFSKVPKELMSIIKYYSDPGFQ